MEDKEKKGSYKKKGSAQESNAQEASNDVNDMEGGMKNAGDVAGVPKKKGAAAKTGSGEKEMTAKELKAEGKKLKQQARDKKKADRKSARATKKSDRKTKKSQKLQDKIDLQTLKGKQKLKSGDVVSSKAKRDRVEKLKTKKEKLDGAAKKKPDANGDGVPDYAQDGIGASRMGFTQSFGAARQNSYAKGAAKVASIMSFGASKKKGAADAGDPAGHKHPHSGTTGSVDFSINDSGATLNKTGKTTSSTPSSSSSSSSSSSPIVDKGDDVFYNNLISSSKDMSAMSAAGINPSNKKAVLNYGNNKAKSMNSTKPSSSSTSSSSSSSNNPVTINSMNSASDLKMQKMLGDVNLATYGKEMQAKQDSVTAYGQTFDKLVKNNPLNLTPQVLGEYDEISGRYGNKAANETRSNNNIPLVDSKTDMPRRSFFNGKETTPSYNNPGVPGGKSKIVNSPTTYSRPGTIFADFKSLFSGGGKRKY